MSKSPLVPVGIITSAHGVKGQVKIKAFLENPEDIFKATPHSDASGSRIFKLKRQGIKNNLLIVSIEGLDDRNVAETLKGTEIYAPAPSKKARKSNQWSYSELTGLEARLATSKPYGKVIGVYNFGAGDILDIQLIDGKTEMLPFNDEFTGEINSEAGYIIVMPPNYIEAKEEP